ncbi:MAG TPA: hypothetical protein VHP36_09320 [Chitinispirillaceae bacterium]|nr:hypothetical protein [Chitinispirillaceae bacterium]
MNGFKKITAATQEQSKEIEMVTQSTDHMDQIIQQNAANSEESASSAEELS